VSLGAQVMKGDKEIVGTLKGFDDYVNMVLEDVTELCAAPLPSVSLSLGRCSCRCLCLGLCLCRCLDRPLARAALALPRPEHSRTVRPCSEITAEGQRVTKLDQILLNGNNIALVRALTRAFATLARLSFQRDAEDCH